MGCAVPRFSVIVPAYEVQPYLNDCLRSVLEQDFTDLELIAVDDHSPDGCGAIIDEAAAYDPRVRPVRLPENAGLGRARNAGIRRATGDYLLFLDCDDTLAPGSLRAIADRLGRPALFQRMVDHFGVLATPPDRLPVRARTEFFRRAGAHQRRYRPLGAAAPPGPVSRTEDELIALFTGGAWCGPRSAALRAAFRARFCPYDDGRAAERVVRRVFLGERHALLPPVVPLAERRPAPAAAAVRTLPNVPAGPGGSAGSAGPDLPAEPRAARRAGVVCAPPATTPTTAPANAPAPATSLPHRSRPH